MVAKNTRRLYCNAKCKNAARHLFHWDTYRENKLQTTYGISLKDYEQKLQDQQGVCDLCGNPEDFKISSSARVYSLCVDHDHATGEVRNLLCRKCNLIVGYVENNEELIMQAIKYLNKFVELKRVKEL